MGEMEEATEGGVTLLVRYRITPCRKRNPHRVGSALGKADKGPARGLTSRLNGNATSRLAALKYEQACR